MQIEHELREAGHDALGTTSEKFALCRLNPIEDDAGSVWGRRIVGSYRWVVPDSEIEGWQDPVLH